MNSQTITAPRSPRTLILGAGLGGLTLAQCLRKRNLPFEIFERDEHISVRSGGWAIALHTILDELKASLPDDLPPLESTNHLLPLDLPAQLCFYDGGPKKAFVESTSEQPIIRANRQHLRELLGTGIDVQWSKSIVRIEQDTQSVRISFEDGSTAVGDVLVGADGANSFVRSHLFPKVRTSTLPAGVINGELMLTSDQFKRQLHLAHSAYVAAADGYHLYVGLNGVLPSDKGARYYWFLNFYDAEAVHEPYWTANSGKREMHDFALEKTHSLNPQYSEIVRLTSENDIRAPPIVFRDLLLNGVPEGRITLLGDAAHPMAPFRGEGGRHAFEDALRLSRILATANEANMVPSLKTYEAEMLPRGRDAVRRSRAVLDPEQGADMKIAWGQPLQMTELSAK